MSSCLKTVELAYSFKMKRDQSCRFALTVSLLLSTLTRESFSTPSPEESEGPDTDPIKRVNDTDNSENKVLNQTKAISGPEEELTSSTQRINSINIDHHNYPENANKLDPYNHTFARIFYVYGPQQEFGRMNLISYYDGCGVKKGCTPEDCSKNHDCQYLVTSQFNLREYVDFQIVRRKTVDKGGTHCTEYTEEKVAYIAIAFTKEKAQEKALVIECSIHHNGTTTMERFVQMGWYENKSYKRWNYECNKGTITGKLITCKVDLDTANHFLCEFRLKRRLVVNQEVFHFAYSPYYIHLVSGCDIADIEHGIEGGAEKFSTPNKVSLNDYEEHVE